MRRISLRPERSASAIPPLALTWRPEAELNRCTGFCRPLPNRSAIGPKLTQNTLGHHKRVNYQKLERETGFKPAASSLARKRSITELLPQ